MIIDKKYNINNIETLMQNFTISTDQYIGQYTEQSSVKQIAESSHKRKYNYEEDGDNNSIDGINYKRINHNESNEEINNQSSYSNEQHNCNNKRTLEEEIDSSNCSYTYERNKILQEERDYKFPNQEVFQNIFIKLQSIKFPNAKFPNYYQCSTNPYMEPPGVFTIVYNVNCDIVYDSRNDPTGELWFNLPTRIDWNLVQTARVYEKI